MTELYLQLGKDFFTLNLQNDALLMVLGADIIKKCVV